MEALIAVAVKPPSWSRWWSARCGSCPRRGFGNVERLGRYQRDLEPGLHFIIPFVDRVRPQIDLREQVVSFQPQPVITEDNLVVNIDTVLYFHVTDARAAAYEINNFIQAAEYDGDHPAQRDRRDGPGGDADLAGEDQQRAAGRARRGHRQVGDPANRVEIKADDRRRRSSRPWRSRCAPTVISGWPS